MTEKTDIDTLLQLVGLAVEIGLENGAETYRVEDTVTRICRSFGYPDAEAVALLTGVFISVDGEAGRASIIRRVRRRTLNLARVNAVNDLSRSIAEGGVDAREALERLKAIRDMDGFAAKFAPFFSALTAGLFALLFGGDFMSFGVAFLCGLSTKLILHWLWRARLTLVLESLLGGLICSAVTVGAYFLLELSPSYVETILSAAIIPLISGLMMTNAVRDTLRGDLLSGLARGVEALLVAIMVALGISALLRFIPAAEAAEPLLFLPWYLKVGLAGLATACFGPLMRVPGRAVLPASLLGALAYAAHLAMNEMLFLSGALSLFIASGLVALLCELLARRMRMIATIFLCVALVPLIPGVSLYRTMRELLLGNDMGALSTGMGTLLAIGAIALGAAIGSLLVARPGVCDTNFKH